MVFLGKNKTIGIMVYKHQFFRLDSEARKVWDENDDNLVLYSRVDFLDGIFFITIKK